MSADERRPAEARLAEWLLEDTLTALSLDGRVQIWNRSAEAVFGYAADEAIGRTLDDFLVPTERLSEARHALAAAIEEASVALETVWRHKDGSHVDVVLSMRRIDRAGIESFIAVSRKPLLRAEILDLNVLVISVEPMVRRLLPEDISLRIVLAAQVATVRIDPSQLEQVLMNLVVNSARAMLQGGTLTIETANMTLGTQSWSRLPVTPGAYVMLAVTDTGIGMDAATLSHIFEPSFTTKDVGEGTGLGLSTVHGIVKQGDGDIWVYGEPAHGTTFKIFLPVVAFGDQLQTDQLQGVTSASRGTETILLVEDGASLRRVARVTLERAGYRVLEAKSPMDAIRVAAKWGQPIDLLLSDVIMPDAIGESLLKRLAPLHPGLRALYMSGYTQDVVIRHGLLIEGMPFLQKPFTPEILLERIRAVLSAPPPAID